ncbi:MAG: type 4a pilus biogenesis protein PilO [bacterium]|jgi:Tfp pilus assembly protein PilO
MKPPGTRAIDTKQRVLVATGLLSVLLAGLFTLTAYSHVQATLASIRENTRQLEAENRSLDLLRELEQGLQQNSVEAARLEQLIPPGEEQARLLAQLVLAARENGVDIIRLEFSPAKITPDSIGEIEIDLILSGLYQDIKSCLRTLTTGQRLLAMNAVELTKREPDIATMTQAQIKLTAYFLPDAVTVASGEQSMPKP